MPNNQPHSAGDITPNTNPNFNPEDPYNLHYSPYHNPIIDRRARAHYYRYSPDISDQEWELVKAAQKARHNATATKGKKKKKKSNGDGGDDGDAISPPFSADSSYQEPSRMKHHDSATKHLSYRTKPYSRPDLDGNKTGVTATDKSVKMSDLLRYPHLNMGAKNDGTIGTRNIDGSLRTSKTLKDDASVGFEDRYSS